MCGTEYEYSFMVQSLEPFIRYCEEHQDQKVEESRQVRILYKKEDQTMARVTIKEVDGKIEKFLDFKQDLLSETPLTKRKESLPLPFESMDVVQSVIAFLGYQKSKVLTRTRIVYLRGDVTFELDSYDDKTLGYVVAIEGKKEAVDEVYEDVKRNFGSYFCIKKEEK